MSPTCLVCREVAGEIELPGGLLWGDEHAVAFHLPPIESNPEPYLGHCMVVTRRHVDHLGDLSVAEAESVARASRSIAFGLRAEGAERVHVAVIGLGGDHFHQHLYPRYHGVSPEPLGSLSMNFPMLRMVMPNGLRPLWSVFARICRTSRSRGPRFGNVTRGAKRLPLRHVSRIADITVERLDVVAAGVEQKRGVVTGRVRSVARRTVGAKAGLDAGTVESVHLLPRSGDEADV